MNSLTRLAGILCTNPQFRLWLAEQGTDEGSVDVAEAAEVVRVVCGIDSRRELDTDPTAAERFHKHLRLPYVAWRDQQGVTHG